MTIQATGNANLSLDARGLLISGASNVDRARIRPSMNGAASIPEIDVQEINLPKGRQSYSRNVLPMRLDYSVEADRNIYITSSTFSSEWGLDLNASGAVGKPELSGRAMLLDGTAFVFNRRFRLEGGEVRFDGAPEDARVDLTATHERTGFSATARIEGPVRSPSVTLSSDPALPEDEILSRLLFDESVSELGAFEAAQLAAQLSGQSLLNIVGQLRDLAGIDRLSVSTDADGNIAVTGGVRLGDNVYVELGTGGTSALGEALVEWQLTPDLSVLSRLSADTDASVAIRWRRDY
jgi:translocation and assembly module TamB